MSYENKNKILWHNGVWEKKNVMGCEKNIKKTINLSYKKIYTWSYRKN